MRLINCATLQLEEFFGTNIPRYAILSHTWGDKEVSFAHFTSGQPIVGSGYQKIIFTCQQAMIDKIGYAWIDTCCIDKSSSAELSEAINSMFAWYQKSVCCYAYLSDVSEANMDQDFPRSRWFTRGWTLQGLLAPTKVIFYDQSCVELGDRERHAERISEITGINERVFHENPWEDLYLLRDKRIGTFSVATRMSWASTRQTTRAEDMAYCLLGIFNINMPLLYGEGHRAFRRLQEEIIRKSDDDSILAWSLSPKIEHPSLSGLSRHDMTHNLCRTRNVDFLARSPIDFKDCADLTRATNPSTLFTLTNTGLQIQLPIVRVLECSERLCRRAGELGRVWIGLLGCSIMSSGDFLGILLYPNGDEDKSSARVTRRRNTWSTVIVSPRVAFGSARKAVTIAGLNGFEEARDFDYMRDEQIIVNQCQGIRGFGYQLYGCKAWELSKLGEPLLAYNTLWDSEAKILTIRGIDPFLSMLELSFETSWSDQNHKFTVFISRTGRGTVREGDIFSDDERLVLKKLLMDGDPPHVKGDVRVQDVSGRPFHINVEVHTKTVGHRQLVRVNLDALENEFSDKENRWICDCEKHIYFP